MQSQMAASLPLAGSKVLCLRNTAEMCNNSAGMCTTGSPPPCWAPGPPAREEEGTWSAVSSPKGGRCSAPAEQRDQHQSTTSTASPSATHLCVNEVPQPLCTAPSCERSAGPWQVMLKPVPSGVVGLFRGETRLFLL